MIGAAPRAGETKSFKLGERQSLRFRTDFFSLFNRGRGKRDGNTCIRSLRFGPLSRASYASPALDTTNSPPDQRFRNERWVRWGLGRFRMALKRVWPGEGCIG